jgi:alpha-tubulin suppressor-like RCC1 family protein
MHRLLALVLIAGFSCHLQAANPPWIAAGGNHTCVAFGLTQVYCWGSNDSGELGNGSTQAIQFTSHVRDVDGTSYLGVTALAAGGQHTCAQRSADNQLVCWGSNASGQLGDRTTDDSPLPRPVIDAEGHALTTSINLSAGGQTSCATARRTSSDGHIACWGANSHGQLGNNSFASSSTAVFLYVPDNVTAVSSAPNHTCYLSVSTSIFCWGADNWGQLGDNTAGSTDAPVPPATSVISSIESIASGTDFNCALSTTGNVTCWGNNLHGQLTELKVNYDASPYYVSGPASFTNLIGIVAGAAHVCALKNDGTVFCWGNGQEGEVGNNKFGTYYRPSEVLDADGVHILSGVLALAAGAAHTCAEKKDGTVWCWGDNTYGQLGNGTHTMSPLPVQVDFDSIFRDGYE